MPDLPGCYALYVHRKLVYVGESTGIRTRVATHLKSNPLLKGHSHFVTVKYKCSRRLGDWRMWELRLITRLKPVGNTRDIDTVTTLRYKSSRKPFLLCAIDERKLQLALDRAMAMIIFCKRQIEYGSWGASNCKYAEFFRDTFGIHAENMRPRSIRKAAEQIAAGEDENGRTRLAELFRAMSTHTQTRPTAA